jgi:hypothetical protein
LWWRTALAGLLLTGLLPPPPLPLLVRLGAGEDQEDAEPLEVLLEGGGGGGGGGAAPAAAALGLLAPLLLAPSSSPAFFCCISAGMLRWLWSGTRSSSMLCAKKHIWRLQCVPSWLRHSCVRYLCVC